MQVQFLELSLQAVQVVGLATARMIACLTLAPPFGRRHMTAMHRNALCVALSLPEAWLLWPMVSSHAESGSSFILLLIKEAAVGSFLGLTSCVPYWSFRSAFALVDNQRGANAAQVSNPSLEADASILGELAERALIAFLAQAGLLWSGMSLLTESYALWPALTLVPNFDLPDHIVVANTATALLGDALVYAAPALIALLLVEFSLAMSAGALQGISVYDSSMSIKSSLALVVMLLYFSALVNYISPQFDSEFLRRIFVHSGR